MDRRQRKTREAIFNAFTQQLSQKDFHQITVGEIIELANVGRATFYAHFETKDYLLKEFCEELFCHIFDVEHRQTQEHRHIFECEGADSAFLHLFRHLKNNDHHILTLLGSRNNDLFFRYFKNHLEQLAKSHLSLFEPHKSQHIPPDFWLHYVTSTLADTIQWWVHNGMKESPEEITDYFLTVV